MGDILVFAEHANGKVKKSAFELLSKANQLAVQAGGNVVAVAIGKGLDGLTNELAAYGAKKVVLAESDQLTQYNTVGYAKALQQVIDELKPSVVLGSASAVGKDFFPRLAVRLKAGLASDVTDLRVEGGKLVAQKPVYSGKAFVDVTFNSPVQMATSRPNSFAIAAAQSGAQAEVIKKMIDIGTPVNPIKEILQDQGGVKVDLTEAEVIVSGGRAMGSADNFKVLQPLAEVLGATVGASRAAVDSGYASHEMQVGQTGKVVNPKLYVACGISGAIQHLAGMRTSKVIVAINKDPEAPIFSKADYGVVGDLFTLVPFITEEVKKLHG
jgi:electron transfer flavoprotein alpha subunit